MRYPTFLAIVSVLALSPGFAGAQSTVVATAEAKPTDIDLIRIARGAPLPFAVREDMPATVAREGSLAKVTFRFPDKPCEAPCMRIGGSYIRITIDTTTSKVVGIYGDQ